MASNTTYSLLEKSQAYRDEDVETYIPSIQSTGSTSKRSGWRMPIICLLLVASVAANIGLTVGIWQAERPLTEFSKTPSPFGRLKFDKPVAYDWESIYGTKGLEHPSESDQAWEAIQVGQGSIALSNTEAEELGLPEAQPFPWDRDRSVYLLGGFHSMHCLRKIRRYVVHLERGIEPYDTSHHVYHCIDALRQDITCLADDTPTYTGNQLHGLTGTGQTRMCRDWNKLEEYARENSACYAVINETSHDVHEIERYKYCPPGSPFANNMRQYFGLPDDWYEKPVEEVEPYW